MYLLAFPANLAFPSHMRLVESFFRFPCYPSEELFHNVDCDFDCVVADCKSSLHVPSAGGIEGCYIPGHQIITTIVRYSRKVSQVEHCCINIYSVEGAGIVYMLD
jgi:hypothetical protein